MAKYGCKSKGGFDFERGLYSTFQNEAPTDSITYGPKWLCKPGKEPVSQKKALLAVINKLVVEIVVARSSLAFNNRLFLVPKPNNNQFWTSVS